MHECDVHSDRKGAYRSLHVQAVAPKHPWVTANIKTISLPRMSIYRHLFNNPLISDLIQLLKAGFDQPVLIQRSEFTELYERGEYYRPEGAMIFSTEYSSTFFVYGGSRNNKPGHWILADRLFEVETKQVTIQNKTRYRTVQVK